MTVDHAAVYDAALTWHHEAQACILPAAADGTKKPGIGKWDRYKTERPTPEVMAGWTWNAIDGIGMVCGAVSGNIEMLELEAAAADLLPGFIQAVSEADPAIAGVLGRYVERTPSGGYHFLYRVDGPVGGNTKLASRPREPDEASPSRQQTLIETRGEGGWTVLAPSAGRTHPSGNAWTILMGQPGVIGTLSPTQRDLLHAVARSYDEMPPPAPQSAPSAAGPTGQALSDTPGADFAERTGWPEILEPAGWRRIYGRGEVTYWQRPGKDDRTISASTGHQGDWLYVFTTSTEFEAGRTYTKFGTYAVLNHNGDHSAAASALRKSGYGKRPPPRSAPARHLTAVPSEEVSSVDGATALQPSPAPAPALSFTDRGNADLMVTAALARGEMLYSPKYKAFYTWQGNRWLLETGDDVTPAVQLFNEVIDSIPAVGQDADLIAKHKFKSMAWRSARDAIQFFKATPAIQVSPDDMDNRPLELNTPSGVVHLLTGEFHPSTPADRHTRLTGVAPDFQTAPVQWLAFLDETFGGDAEMIGYIQRLAGYSMTGAITHEVMPFLYGSGANGKSVLLVVLAEILGDYASSAPPDFLLSRTSPAHETEIARLHGQRFVVCSEVPHNARFNEGRMKALCSQEKITGRFMGKDHITFKPSHHLWLAGNHEPAIPGGGNGFWRRFRKIPFHHTVPSDQQDPDLASKLMAAEGPSIMAWMIQGAMAQAQGLADPPEVLLATEEYASSEDQLGRFLTECVKESPGIRVETKDVSAAYNRWLMLNNERPAFPGSRLGRELKVRGFVRQDSSGKAYYRDTDLLRPEAEPDQPTQEELRYGK